MKYIYIIIISLLVISCENSNDTGYSDEITYIRSLDPIEAVDVLNEWRDTKPEILSYINADNIVISFPDNEIVELELPEDKMFVAIAPYVDETHQCYFHYFSSCMAEMKSKSFTIELIDNNTNSSVSKEVNSLNNGFFELWLDRNKKYEIFVKYSNKTGNDTINTFSKSRTCITTVHLGI